MKVRCGHCKTDLATTDKAVAHVTTHKPKALAVTREKPLFHVRYDRKGGIAEVLSSPPLLGV